MTEIAGVIIASPKNSDAPNTPSAISTAAPAMPVRVGSRRTSATSAIMPPSPSLSACITSQTYLTPTTRT